MNESIIIHLTSELLWLVLLLSLPIIVLASAVGILVSIFQALTQIQDQTLQFLIKLIVVAITLAATYHWMGSSLLNYSILTFNQIGRMSS